MGAEAPNTNTKSPRLLLRFVVALAVSYAPALILLLKFGPSVGLVALPLGIYIMFFADQPWLLWLIPCLVISILWASRNVMPLLVTEVIFFVISGLILIWIIASFREIYGG